jgi:4-diphosphocytidyl-2-C-methyl-D-erythritol kinase
MTIPSPYVSDMLMQALRAGDPILLGKALDNDLQAAAISLRPSLAQVLEFGEDFGALGGVVSGSGPTCAFIARDLDQATDLAVALTSTGLTRTVTTASSPAPGARIVA